MNNCDCSCPKCGNLESNGSCRCGCSECTSNEYGYRPKVSFLNSSKEETLEQKIITAVLDQVNDSGYEFDEKQAIHDVQALLASQKQTILTEIEEWAKNLEIDIESREHIYKKLKRDGFRQKHYDRGQNGFISYLLSYIKTMKGDHV